MSLPYYRIDLSEVPGSLANRQDEPLVVTPQSPIKLRREVERFARYFRREFNYDARQFEATEKPEKRKRPYAAYLFSNEPNCIPRVWVGACCFRWREYQDVGPRWAMQWMWLHPYYRGKGILSGVWDEFHELHGNFYCEPPFSLAMEAFLRKQGKCIICWQPLDRPVEVTCACCEAQYQK